MNIIQIPKYNNSLKDKKCVVCGSPAFAHFQGSPYCRKHYMQMKRGGVKDRTTRDPNELIDMGSCIKIVLYNRLGLKIDDFGIIDDDCVKLIQGKKVGYGKFGDKKYCYINIKGKPILLHRYIWEELKGKIPQGKVVDHINGNGLDCRISNLRLASSLENSYNLGKENKYTGVNPYGKDKFSARIMHDRKDYNLGVYPSVQDALKARIEAERKYFGDFGPNVSRFDRGLINYSDSYIPTRTDALSFIFPSIFTRDVVSANAGPIIDNEYKNSNGLFRWAMRELGAPLTSAAIDIGTWWSKDKLEENDRRSYYLRLESAIGRQLTNEERAHLDSVLTVENVDPEYKNRDHSRSLANLGNATVITGSSFIPGAGPVTAKALTTAGTVASGLYTDAASKSSSENYNDYLSMSPDSSNQRDLVSGRTNKLAPNNLSPIDYLKPVDLGFYYKLKKEADVEKVRKEEKLKQLDAEQEKNENKNSNLGKVALPIAMAGLALGGYMLYKKNKEKKEKKKKKKQYVDEE